MLLHWIFWHYLDPRCIAPMLIRCKYREIELLMYFLVFSIDDTHQQWPGLSPDQRLAPNHDGKLSNVRSLQVCKFGADPIAAKMLFFLSRWLPHPYLASRHSIYSDCSRLLSCQIRCEPIQEYHWYYRSVCEKHWLWNHVQML